MYIAWYLSSTLDTSVGVAGVIVFPALYTLMITMVMMLILTPLRFLLHCMRQMPLDVPIFTKCVFQNLILKTHDLTAKYCNITLELSFFPCFFMKSIPEVLYAYLLLLAVTAGGQAVALEKLFALAVFFFCG